MTEYIRFSENYKINKLIPISESPYKLIKSNSPYFISMMKYNEAQYQEWKKTNTLKQVSGGKTNKIWADFDSKDNLKLAFNDCNTFVSRMLELGFEEKNIQISFSGNKGTGIIIETDQEFTIEQVKAFCMKYAEDLKTFDTVMYDHQRIFRLLFSKNEKTGLYKIPLTLEELQEGNVQAIKDAAADLANFDQDAVVSWYKQASNKIEIPQLVVKPPKESRVSGVAQELDLSNKPPHWKNYKWALAQGHFEAGERHQALMVVAATCRGLGYDKETTYYICKSALKKQSERTGTDDFPKEELWNNIIEQSVFSEGWNGGQFSPKTNPWLAAYCERMGIKVDNEEEPFVDFEKMTDKFLDYATNFEQNIIKTGIYELDKNVMYSTSTLNGLLGQPGAGKTSLALEFLRNSSLNGVNSVFFSMDMGLPVVYAKLIQKAAGMNFKQALDMAKNNPKKTAEIIERVKEEYKNVAFNFKSGLSVKDMESFIKYHEDQTGKKVKLVVADYLECISSKFSDPGASCGLIANELKDLASENELCVQLLLQTQKHSTPDISDPLMSLKNVKGNSLIEQACTTITTLWREGYSPSHVDDDKYISFAVVKNRFGPLWHGDCSWEGKTGSIRSLTDEERGHLAAFKERKKIAKIEDEKEKRAQWEG